MHRVQAASSSKGGRGAGPPRAAARRPSSGQVAEGRTVGGDGALSADQLFARGAARAARSEKGLHGARPLLAARASEPRGAPGCPAGALGVTGRPPPSAAHAQAISRRRGRLATNQPRTAPAASPRPARGPATITPCSMHRQSPACPDATKRCVRLGTPCRHAVGTPAAPQPAASGLHERRVLERL